MPSKMRNAFIRVSAANDTLDGMKTYTIDDIEKILTEWCLTANFLYYFIEHPADDEINQTHWHILLRFPSPTQFDTIKNKFPYGDIEPARNTRNCIQYMVHLNDVTKKPYSWDEIRTNDKNTDWYRVQSRSSQEIALHAVIERIVSGEIPQYRQIELIPPSLWTKYNVQITKAFEFYTKKIASDPNREISTIYFSGSTCTGKTTIAKEWCRRAGLSYYVSSASNDVMQGYEGQEVLILDDFRGDMEKKGSSRSFNLPDFLKMTDQNTRSSIKSRYSNKDFIGSYIIITSSRPIYDMYFNLEVEDKHQLFRRVSSQYQFTKDKIYLSAYSQEFHKYLPIGSMPNPASEIYSEEKPLQCSVSLADSFGTTVTPFESSESVKPSNPGDSILVSPDWLESEDGKRWTAAKQTYLENKSKCNDLKGESVSKVGCWFGVS